MKKRISHRIIGDSGPLMISWFHGPKGDAVESKNGVGVGFFSPSGEILAVEFDDVQAKNDHQILEFEHYLIEVTVKSGKTTYFLKRIEAKESDKKKRKRVA